MRIVEKESRWHDVHRTKTDVLGEAPMSSLFSGIQYDFNIRRAISANMLPAGQKH